MEVATGASTIDPIVRVSIDGLLCSLLAVRASARATVVDLSVGAHVLAREPQVITVGAPPSIECERREYDDLVADERLTVAAQGGSRRVLLGGGASTLDLDLR